jgi:hypothetical protein
VEAEDKPLELIPAVIDEVSDGVTQMVPVLQNNWIGAVLLIALLSTTTICAVVILTTWNQNAPFTNVQPGLSHHSP